MIRYRVSSARPAAHHFDVRLSIDVAPAELRLFLPAWTPGSYLIREFARNLREVAACGEGGRAIAVSRLDKDTLHVAAEPGTPVTIDYRVYAFERSVRTSYVDANGGLLNGASVFLAVEGATGGEHAVELALPADWTAATALERAPDGSLRAADYSRLIDAPILVGRLREYPFHVGGVPHAIVFLGDGNYDGRSLAQAAERIVAVNARTFGGLPYRRYVFLTLATPDGRGGLEHVDSSVLQHPRFEFREENALTDFHSLVAHEHLHAWNVKRFRPADFHPYDLRRETYTRLLWLVEGVTAYQDELIPLRAGLVPRDRYLKRLADELTRYHETPGRRMQTLEEASLLAWVRHYRQDEDTPNSGVNYYQQGALAALALDLELRASSEGRHGVDDLLLALDREFGDGRRGYSAADVEAIASELAGHDLSATFHRLYRTTKEHDFTERLAEFGVIASRGTRRPAPLVRDLIGARIDPNGVRPTIDVVERGSPADRAGLSPKDELVAVDGFRVRTADLARRLADRAPGRARITVFRDEMLVEVEVELCAPSAHAVTLIEDPTATPRARMLRDAWLMCRAPAGAR